MGGNVGVRGVAAVVVAAVGVGVTAASVVIGAAHVWPAAAIIAAFRVAPATAVADHAAAARPSGLKPPFAVSAVVDGHSAFRVDGTHATTAIEAGLASGASFDAGTVTRGIKIGGVSRGGRHALSASGPIPRSGGLCSGTCAR